MELLLRDLNTTLCIGSILFIFENGVQGHYLNTTLCIGSISVAISISLRVGYLNTTLCIGSIVEIDRYELNKMSI